MATKITFPIPHRWLSEAVFTAEIECSADASHGFKLGLAVKAAFKAGADLSGADLRGADLSGADLRGADLSGAVLSGADLRDAVLSGADLRRAVLSRAVLSDAVLSDADLRGADLRGADLSRAVLSRADLRGADLRGAVLNSFKADFWMILHGAQAEVPGVIAALKAGRVNGSTYHGDCACLVGTIANVRGVDVDTLEQNSRRPAEQWFLMIREGDKPGYGSGGGFAAQKALEWAEEYCALAGIDIKS